MPDKTQIPVHVGLILDGNRRWARGRGLPTLEGHRKGYDTLKEVSRAAFDSGVKFVSAYAFSAENWNRTAKEVNYLMSFALRVLTRDIKELDEENIKVVWLGSREKLDDKLLKAIEKAEDSTANNTRGTLGLCFNYGGHDELVDAARKIVAQGIPPLEITKDVLAGALYAPEIPPVDFLIRTSGEHRLSGFMLHRAAYAELYFTDTLWPDFTPADLGEALAEYARRERRIGK